jgi:hypothetical protein
MNHDNLAQHVHAGNDAEAVESQSESSREKALSPSDAINWLRYLAKCKQRLSQVSTGEKESGLAFQAHVMREAARHLEELSR